ncbi:MAG: DNA-3-methyladenine glycosylase I [Planctomycetales bacterium]|nr:DNA-3-methyladenine glycosylase I [Planctomycetales bacterium]
MASKSNSRCEWTQTQVDPAYLQYHDQEWGVPVHDDRKQFEFIILEGAQAGLSWWTVLRKREGYRKAFADFNPEKVAKFTEKRILKLMENASIIRNQLKIRAAVTNARCFLKVQAEFGSFDSYIWQFVEGRPIQNKWRTLRETPTTTAESDALSKDLKQRGFKFVGSTVIYAHMQATGMVNDHQVNCFRHRECAKLG